MTLTFKDPNGREWELRAHRVDYGDSRFAEPADLIAALGQLSTESDGPTDEELATVGGGVCMCTTCRWERSCIYTAGAASRQAEVDRLTAELDGAWKATKTPVRGMVDLGEVVESIRSKRDELLESLDHESSERAIADSLCEIAREDRSELVEKLRKARRQRNEERAEAAVLRSNLAEVERELKTERIENASTARVSSERAKQRDEALTSADTPAPDPRDEPTGKAAHETFKSRNQAATPGSSGQSQGAAREGNPGRSDATEQPLPGRAAREVRDAVRVPVSSTEVGQRDAELERLRGVVESFIAAGDALFLSTVGAKPDAQMASARVGWKDQRRAYRIASAAPAADRTAVSGWAERDIEECRRMRLAAYGKPEPPRPEAGESKPDPHHDPECASCGHVASDHRPGGCGACCEDEGGDSVKCDCRRFREEEPKPEPQPSACFTFAVGDTVRILNGDDPRTGKTADVIGLYPKECATLRVHGEPPPRAPDVYPAYPLTCLEPVESQPSGEPLPLPWCLEFDGTLWSVMSADGQHVADDLREADAALIVAHCNPALPPERQPEVERDDGSDQG